MINWIGDSTLCKRWRIQTLWMVGSPHYPALYRQSSYDCQHRLGNWRESIMGECTRGMITDVRTPHRQASANKNLKYTNYKFLRKYMVGPLEHNCISAIHTMQPTWLSLLTPLFFKFQSQNKARSKERGSQCPVSLQKPTLTACLRLQMVLMATCIIPFEKAVERSAGHPVSHETSR